MARKLLKEQQSEAREIVKQIFNLALAINPNDTKQETTGGKPTVFVNFSGHVVGIDVSIYRNGWRSSFNDDSEMSRYTIWLDDEMFTVLTDDYEPYPEEKECEQLSKAKAALAELKRIAEEWGVDYV
jgi:hypothetical protein